MLEVCQIRAPCLSMCSPFSRRVNGNNRSLERRASDCGQYLSRNTYISWLVTSRCNSGLGADDSVLGSSWTAKMDLRVCEQFPTAVKNFRLRWCTLALVPIFDVRFAAPLQETPFRERGSTIGRLQKTHKQRRTMLHEEKLVYLMTQRIMWLHFIKRQLHYHVR